jgi:tRNA (guanine37-N1)-methyltransferase
MPKKKQLRDLLKGTIPQALLKKLPNRFDVVGDIAVLSIPTPLLPYRFIVADAIMANRRNIYTVLNKTAKIAGDSRTARYEVLAGDTTITIHHEFKFSYHLDLAKVFFNTRLSHERNRVVSQVEPGERVLVPFAGVGPFAIPAAAKGAEVVAVEQSPDAYQWLLENIRINKVKKRVAAIRGDAFDTSLLPHTRFDRAIIPAPYSMDAVLDAIAPVVLRDGMIHFYTFKKRHQIPGLVREYADRGFGLTYYNSCGNVAPGVSRWVFDLVRE